MESQAGARYNPVPGKAPKSAAGGQVWRGHRLSQQREGPLSKVKSTEVPVGWGH